MTSIPPTPLIVAFDAVARLRSFNKAADELHLSHSTVSHRIRALESTLGFMLFSRSTRAVALTADGAHLHQQIKPALHALEQAFGAHAGKRDTVRISVLPSFARFRLVPALASLPSGAGAPAIEISPTTEVVDIDKGDADIAIRFARSQPAAFHCRKLMDDAWFPVAAPAYLQRVAAGSASGIFRQATLLAHTRQPWQTWFDRAGLAPPDNRRVMTFTDTGFMLDAALGLQGIALGRRSLVHELLLSGELVRLSDVGLPCEQSYYLLASERATITRHGRAVLDWIAALVQHG